MSFILDALRKVEQERRQGAAFVSAGEGRIARLERSKRRRGQALMLAIALGSAGLTAVVLRLVPHAPVEAEPPTAAVTGEVPDRGGEPSEELEAETSSSAAGAPEASLRSVAVAPAPVRTRTKSTPPARSSSGSAAGRPSTPPPPVPEPVRERGEVDPGTVEESPAAEARVESSANAIRLVGSESSAHSKTTTAPPSPASPAADRPQLVLQGTSVIDGHPVAVISDRRVFEGDHIEGALVIRIEERSVELEFEGRRFTLSF